MKYIVDIDVFDTLFKVDSIGVFGIGKSVVDSEEDHSWSRIKSIEEFEELTADYINEHFGQLQDDAYKKGFEDGKSVNDKGCEGCKYAEMGSDTTICAECCNAYHNQWTAKNDKIEVGDTVNIKDTSRSDGDGIVTKIWNNLLYIMWNDGSSGTWDKEEVVKTGRHFDIESILEEMRND